MARSARSLADAAPACPFPCVFTPLVIAERQLPAEDFRVLFNEKHMKAATSRVTLVKAQLLRTGYESSFVT